MRPATVMGSYVKSKGLSASTSTIASGPPGMQKRFLLTPFPPHCSFCMPGGPEAMVEVLADKPFDFTYEPIVVSGRMAILDDDIVYYRITNASPVAP